MKTYRIILWLALLLPLAGMAQEERIEITETFEGSTSLEWPEYAEKGRSALLQDGCFKLQSTKKGKAAAVGVELPIRTDRDFMIESTVVADKLNPMTCFSFGIGTDAFTIFEGRLYHYTVDEDENANGLSLLRNRPEKIKLKGGKEVAVAIRFEYRNGKSSLSINNMKVAEFDRPIAMPACSFGTVSTLSIREFSLIQE